MKKKDMEDLDLLPVDHQFDILLYRKTMEKTTTQRTSMNKYYRDIYNKTGVIPEGLFYREGRKASGRKRSLSKEIEKYFIKMVKKSANDDVNSPDFITKKLRTVVNFHRRLEEKYGKISIDALYRLVSKHGLRKYFDKLDYTDDECNKILEYFDDIPTFDKIQIDGCRFKYIEIKDDNNNWKRPCVIEFLDTGSRFMLSMDIYFSESNESSVDIFSKFLKSTAFPKKKIQLRPDNAKAFLNLKRPVKELNHKYSFPDEFYFDNDFAKIRKPKNKAHLESSHRRLHGFEDFIISKLPQDKMIERVPGVKVKNTSGKVEIATISRFDISLEELRKTRFIELYRKEHNERARIFSVAGRYKKWQPMEKFKDYISNCETFYFKETDIEECLKYGFRKEIAHVRPNGKIRFKNKDYQVVTGDFYGGIKSIKVKVSEHNKKLYIFELPENGIGIGEAMLISETEKPIYKIKKNTKEKILKKNEFEHLVIYLERQGMTIKKTQLERLMLLHKKGLNVETAKKIIEIHKKTYNSYLKNSSFNNLQVGIILCNLFFTHFAEYKRTLND